MTMLLSVHPDVSLAKDPYLPLFRSFRNELLANLSNSHQFVNFNPSTPLDEYYYFDEKLEVLSAIQKSDLSLSFDVSQLSQLMDNLGERMSLSSPMLIPYLNQLQGNTYTSLFDSALKIVGLGRNTPDTMWLGFNDNWTVEFFAPLARAFPDAKFIIFIRDVRSSIASHLRLADPKLIALTLSFVRHWRKMIAFACHFLKNDLLQDRICVVKYEDLVLDPENTARSFCDFLEIEFTPEMVDTNHFIGPHGGPWIPNSNFDVPQQGIYKESVDRWKHSLSVDVIQLVEFVVGPDLEYVGYELFNPTSSMDQQWGAYQRHLSEHRQCLGWRTDNHNPDIDFALELFRRYCLRFKIEDPAVIARCFLFPELYESLFNKQNLI